MYLQHPILYTLLILANSSLLAAGYDYTDEYDEEMTTTHVQLPRPDFQADARHSQRNNIPIMVLFSAEYCEYCLRLKEEFLQPMQISGDYDNRVIMREIDIDGIAAIQDFDQSTRHEYQIAQRLEIELVPTIIYLDHLGREIITRTVGMATTDIQGGYLDRDIFRSQRLMSGH